MLLQGCRGFDALYIEVAKVEFLETKRNELVTTYIVSVDANCQTDLPASVDAVVQTHVIDASMFCSKVAEAFPFSSDNTKDGNNTDDTAATPMLDPDEGLAECA